MMKAASASETSVNFYQTTRRNVPEDIHLQGMDRTEAEHTTHVDCFLGIQCALLRSLLNASQHVMENNVLTISLHNNKCNIINTVSISVLIAIRSTELNIKGYSKR
jgi:hypothetical protein